MLSASEIRERWLAQLVSTQPVDQPRAQRAVAELYGAAGMAEPKFYVWFESPSAASWAVALLDAHHSRAFSAVIDGARSAAEQEQIDRARSAVLEACGTPSWGQAVSLVGRPIQHGAPDTFQAEPLIIALTHDYLGLYDDVTSLFTTAAEEDELSRAETAYWGSLHGVLATQEHWSATNPVLGQHFFTQHSFSKMASAEAEASRSGRPLPRMLAAAAETGRSCGLWWPFAGGAVLSGRPTEVHLDPAHMLHRAGGPAATYGDGVRIYAWHGKSMREQWIMRPETLSARELKTMPADFRQHVAGLAPKAASKPRKSTGPAAAGATPFLERYRAGEYREVWSELIALGPAVREKAYAADALAVAQETMRRVETNVRTVTSRLNEMGYVFRTAARDQEDWIQGAESMLTFRPQAAPAGLERLFSMFAGARELLGRQVQQAKAAKPDPTVQAHVPPAGRFASRLRELENAVGTLPLSLRAFYEIVGSVDWTGEHPTLAPASGTLCPDPLVVYGLDDALAEREMDEEGDAITIAPDDLHKANVSGGDAYEIAVPDPHADGRVLNERHDLYFVDYLRLCFEYGGFPGYEGVEKPPAELATLRADLLPF